MTSQDKIIMLGLQMSLSPGPLWGGGGGGGGGEETANTLD